MAVNKANANKLSADKAHAAKETNPAVSTNQGKSAERENLFAQVTRMSQEKRAVSDRRSEARRATERVEISRQIAARTPPPKPKPVDNVRVAAAQLDGEADTDIASQLEIDGESDDASEGDAAAPTKIDRPA